MDLENLTIKDVRKLFDLFNSPKNDNDLYSRYRGKYVIVRSYNEGVNAGFVEDADETGIILSQARRLWYHKAEDLSLSWYEGVAISGLHKDSKITAPALEKAIIEKYSITICSEKAKESIINHPIYHG